MNKRFFLITLLLALLLLLTVPALSFADFGDFSGDSDFGGSDWGSDWGSDSSSDWGSDWGSDSSSDWGSDSSSDWGSDSSDWSSDDSSAYSSGIVTADDWSSDRGSDDDSSGGGFFGILIIAIIVIVVIAIFARKKKSVAPGAKATDIATLRPISELIAKDPNFTEAAFTEKLGNMYVAMQQAWQNKDISEMRAHFSDAMYNQFARQIETYKQNRQTNYVERIAVLGTNLVGWREDEANDAIVARLQTRIVDYVLDDTTGKLVRGDRNKEKFMDYEWTLIRSKGTLTKAEGEGTKQVNCNKCGAPVDINRTAVCEYCGAVLTSSEYDWVISAIKGISQRTS